MTPPDTLTTGRHTAVAVDTSLIGVVLGNFRITAALSSGGMGAVYRAKHELLDHDAAIKLLRPELSANEEHVHRFFTEAKAATQIKHPGIVEVYDFGYTTDGNAYLVMEFLDGQPLSRAVAQRGHYSEIEAASIARSIASVLKAAHAKGIVHRDLKPDNVFVLPDPDGRGNRIKVLDFGIAKLAHNAPNDRRRTQTGVLMGTPKYMAPEQAREAGTIDHRADLYSLGCILYELITGHAPFVAEGAGEIIAMQLFTEPEPPSKLTAVSPELEALVLRLLAKEPADRYQSASDVMSALEEIGARMSGPRDAITVDSNIRIQSSARLEQFSELATMPAVPAAAEVQATIVDPPRKPSKLPYVLAGLALAIVTGTIAFFASQRPESATPPPPVAPAPPTIAPAKEPEKVATPTPTPIPVPVPVVVQQPAPEKKSPGKPIKKGAPVETKLETGSATPPKTGPTSPGGSPIETTLDETPKKAP